jgi:hypothetical protein
MQLSVQLKAMILGFALVAASFMASWIAAIVSGGFKFGSLARRVELTLKPEELSGFMERFQRRLAELGFQPGNQEGQFLQGGAAGGEFAAFTHARTKKELKVAVRDDSRQAPKVEMILRYLDPIVGDSGESAYRDAVLDFVSGRTEAMQVVPNRSFAALCSLVGGICTWVAVLVLYAMHYDRVSPIVVLGLTEATTGVLAIIAIRGKPGELTGTGLAIAGIVTSVSGVVFAAGLWILTAATRLAN